MTIPRAGQAYRPRNYWGAVHDLADLRAVGHPTLPLSFNRHLYANAAVGVLRALDAASVELAERSVLDVGSGTGFWIELWRRQGASAVSGADLVPEAVDRLRNRFPDVDLTAVDVTEREPFPGRTFDVVTIMSVLHHVVDEERFSAALRNLAAQLAPGGRLVVLDPLVVRGRWMPAAAESAHNVVRTRTQWERALSAAGLRLVSVHPTAAFLSDPVDAGSRAGFTLHRLVWRVLTRAFRGRETVARIGVPPLAALDRAITARLRSGPSTKLLVIERADRLLDD